MWNKRKVVMLPTNEKANLYLQKDKPLLYIKNPEMLNEINIKQYQHLYILSDEEIKEGDWFITNDSKSIFQCGKFEPMKGDKKIIATTDKSLRIGELKEGGRIEHLPQPSQSFIEYFIEEYNKANIITDVMVEYFTNIPVISDKEYEQVENGTLSYKDTNPYTIDILKINPNNIININIKPIISESEVIGEKIVEYCKQYEGTNKYNDVLKAIEFGYQLSLNKDEK